MEKHFTAASQKDDYTNISTLESGLALVKSWMDSNQLKTKESKTEFIMCGSRQLLAKCVTT